MDEKLSSNKIYKPSEDVVAREVGGEFIIIPITSGIGGSEDAIFSLNETGIDIWKRLDGERSLGEIKEELKKDYEASAEEISA